MIWISAAHPAPGSERIISVAILSGKILKNARISRLQMSVSIPSLGSLAPVAACLLRRFTAPVGRVGGDLRAHSASDVERPDASRRPVPAPTLIASRRVSIWRSMEGPEADV